jgi:hypothetical protein
LKLAEYTVILVCDYEKVDKAFASRSFQPFTTRTFIFTIIPGIGTDLLKEIEAFMNSDKNEAVKKAVSKHLFH